MHKHIHWSVKFRASSALKRIFFGLSSASCKVIHCRPPCSGGVAECLPPRGVRAAPVWLHGHRVWPAAVQPACSYLPVHRVTSPLFPTSTAPRPPSAAGPPVTPPPTPTRPPADRTTLTPSRNRVGWPFSPLSHFSCEPSTACRHICAPYLRHPLLLLGIAVISHYVLVVLLFPVPVRQALATDPSLLQLLPSLPHLPTAS